MLLNRCKYIVSIFLFLLTTACFTQINSPSEILKGVETSNNYSNNIRLLDSTLKQKTISPGERLNLQILLVNNYISTQQFDKAAALCQKGILEAKQKKLTYNEASFYLALGRTYYNLKQIDKMLQYTEECRKLAEDFKYNDLLKKCYHNMGVIALEKGNDLKTAETNFLKAIDIGKKTPSGKKENLGRNYRLLATIYDSEGKYKKADSTFKIAGDIYKLYGDSSGLTEVLIFRARLLRSIKKTKEALELSKQSILMARLCKSQDHIQTALSIYDQINSESGNYKEAYTALREILAIELSKSSNTLKKELAESEARFKVAELKNKQELTELESKQTRQNYIYAFAIIFIVTFSILIFLYQKRLSKREQELSLKTVQEVFLAEEKERTRIAKDLHDNMGAYATSILAQIDGIEISPEPLKNQKISDLRSDAESIMSTLRETIWILKTKTISVVQFFDLVKIYSDKQLVKNLGIKVTYLENCKKNMQLSPGQSLNLYRIVQEIIQNIVKHASPTQVTIRLEQKDRLLIEISDNGKGFNSLASVRRSGLENIEFRAREIRYHLSISSTIGIGTTVKVEELK